MAATCASVCVNVCLSWVEDSEVSLALWRRAARSSRAVIATMNVANVRVVAVSMAKVEDFG